MQITITQDQIQRGQITDSSQCPAAIAIREATGLMVNVYPVSGAYFSRSGGLFSKGRVWHSEIPRNLADFIIDFDARRPVKPLTFEISVPELTG